MEFSLNPFHNIQRPAWSGTSDEPAWHAIFHYVVCFILIFVLAAATGEAIHRILRKGGYTIRALLGYRTKLSFALWLGCLFSMPFNIIFGDEVKKVASEGEVIEVAYFAVEIMSYVAGWLVVCVACGTFLAWKYESTRGVEEHDKMMSEVEKQGIPEKEDG
ncbi:hypothetical protein LTR27_006393 [Elasticomyces elasticus]|nr:hypothetical protein LTR27_006393 [Elasticomyces elasticus]